MNKPRLKPTHKHKQVWIVLSGHGVPMYGFMEASRQLALHRAKEPLGPPGKHECPCGCGAVFGDYSIVRAELRWTDPWAHSALAKLEGKA